jgi:hypothetical protein
LPNYRSGGIRLNYRSHTEVVEGVKVGILLEVGFDDVTPNNPLTISPGPMTVRRLLTLK